MKAIARKKLNINKNDDSITSSKKQKNTTIKQAKFSHTHYRALGPELILVTCSQPVDESLRGGMLPLFSVRHAVTFPAEERHHPSTGTKLYCLMTEAHRCEQLAQGCYAALPR